MPGDDPPPDILQPAYLFGPHPVAWNHCGPPRARRQACRGPPGSVPAGRNGSDRDNGRSTSMRKILFMVGTAVFSRVMAKRRENKNGRR